MSCHTDAIILRATLCVYYKNWNNYPEEEDNDADVNINYVHPHLDRWHPAGAADRQIWQNLPFEYQTLKLSIETNTVSICMLGLFQINEY